MKMASLAVFSLVFLVGCSSLVPLPDGPDVGPKEANEAWARVLKQNVNKEGQINFKAVGDKPADIKLYIRYVSRADVKGMSASDRLAFYLNAYNALSMYNVIVSDYPKDLDGLFKRISFFAQKRYVVAGTEYTLRNYENDVVRKEGDPRVHVALNCMCAGCPRLPQEPFTGGKLEAELEREAKKFYNEERNVRTDATKKIVYISEILSFFTEDFLKKKPTLIEYVNLYRKEKVPADYKVEFIPYNWTINRQPGT